MVLQKNNDGTFSLKVGGWVGSLIVGFALYLLAQSVIALRWGANLDTRVAAIETVIVDMKVKNGVDVVQEREVQIRLARVEERVTAIYELLRRFEATTRRSSLPLTEKETP